MKAGIGWYLKSLGVLFAAVENHVYTAICLLIDLNTLNNLP